MALETWSPSGSIFDPQKPPGEGWAQTGTTRVPTYAPPKAGWEARWKTVPVYSRMAQQAAQDPAPTSTPAAPAATAPAPASAPTYLPVSPPPEPPGPTMQDLASQFTSQIQEMQKGFMQSMMAQTAEFEKMQQVQQDRMAQLQQQMLQAQIQQQERPTVTGVKTATGTGGDMMQIARRGVSGAFGRRGMRIKGLNVG